MKKMIGILFLLLLQPVFAETHHHLQKIFTVQIGLNFKQPHQKEYSLVDSIKMTSTNHGWQVIQHKFTNERILLLGKVANTNTKEIMMKFLVLDMNKTPRIISAPQMRVRYGQKGELDIHENQQSMKLSVLANIG